jgi:hypothetical protein
MSSTLRFNAWTILVGSRTVEQAAKIRIIVKTWKTNQHLYHLSTPPTGNHEYVTIDFNTHIYMSTKDTFTKYTT